MNSRSIMVDGQWKGTVSWDCYH